MVTKTFGDNVVPRLVTHVAFTSFPVVVYMDAQLHYEFKQMSSDLTDIIDLHVHIIINAFWMDVVLVDHSHLLYLNTGHRPSGIVSYIHCVFFILGTD